MKISKLSKISDLTDSSRIYGVYHCYFKDQKKTRYGDPFLNLSLSDSSGNINAKIWDNADYYNSKFDEGDIVCVKGDTDIYRSKLVLNVSHISRFENDRYLAYGFNPNTLISKLEVDVKSLWNEVTAYFSKTEKCKGLIKSICKDYKKEFLSFPFSMELPYQIEKSYIFTIYKAFKIADLLLLDDFNKNINPHIVYTMIFLYKFSNLTSYEKKITYSLKDEAVKRGELNMFYDIFKKYKKTISADDYFILEKGLFDSKSKDFHIELDIITNIFSVIQTSKDEND